MRRIDRSCLLLPRSQKSAQDLAETVASIRQRKELQLITGPRLSPSPSYRFRRFTR